MSPFGVSWASILDFTEMAVAMSLDADSDATRPGTAMEAFCHECNCYIFWVNYFQNMFTCVCVCVCVCVSHDSVSFMSEFHEVLYPDMIGWVSGCGQFHIESSKFSPRRGVVNAR